MPQNDAEEVTEKLDADDAQKLYIENYGLDISVDSKLAKDHFCTAPNLSSSTSIKDAVDRYSRNQKILKSSFFVANETTVKNKAGGGKKIAMVHQGSQQMAVAVKVTRRTVEIEVLKDKKEASRYRDVHQVEVKGEIHYLTCSSAEKDVTLKLIGPWDPIKGTFSLYHYEEGTLPTKAEMVAKYLPWVMDDGKPIRPVAKK